MLTYNRTGADAAEKTMTYQGNRLTGVSSSGSGASGSVSYDAIGRVVSSDIEGMTEVQYNVAGFPSYIGQADGGYVHNTYAGGVRLSSRRTAADGEVTVMNYEGNEVWENGKLRMLLFDGGYVDFSGNRPKYCWYTKDHLGNVRAVADSLGYIVASYDYRPYGEELAALPADEYLEPAPDDPRFPRHGRRDEETNEPTPQPSPFVPTVNYSEAAPKGWQPFRFGGKESLTRVGLDLYDFGARMYSPSNARWLTMDPLCEKFYDTSPYVYCNGNPVNIIDPDGQAGETLWDLASLGIGVKSFVSNVKEGKVGAAIVDGIGIVVDAAAVLTPFVPGGASAGLKAIRGAGKTVDAATDMAKAVNKADDVADAAKSVSQTAMQRGVANEAKTLNALGETKNTKSFTVKLGNDNVTTIPDINNATTVGEIKDVKNLSNTKQIRAEAKAATETGKIL